MNIAELKCCYLSTVSPSSSSQESCAWTGPSCHSIRGEQISEGVVECFVVDLTTWCGDGPGSDNLRHSDDIGNQQSTVESAVMCVYIIVHNCRSQHTEQTLNVAADRLSTARLIVRLNTRRSQHSQECKNPCRHCFCAS